MGGAVVSDIDTMVITWAEHLLIDGVPTCTPAWDSVDLSELWAGADQKGQDRELAGAAVILNPRSDAPSRRQVPMQFRGIWDPWGELYDDRRAGAWRNYRLFRDLCVGPGSGEAGTRTLVLITPDGSELVGVGHVLKPFTPRHASNDILRATLVIDLPYGELVEDEES